MKTKALFICILIGVAFFSCSKESNPIVTSETTTLIGSIGSQRSYLITEKWFIPESDTPFVTIPDSLLTRITLNDSLRRLGVVKITQEVESVNSLDTSFYNSWRLILPRSVYKMAEGNGSLYSLPDELERLLSNVTYSPSGWYESSIWYETPDQVQNVLPTEMLPIFPSLPWLKKPLQVGHSWIRYQFIDTSTGQVRHQISAKVVGQEFVTVKAGTFLGFKLVLFSNSGSPPELSKEFEYYVPNTGLVLYEDDRRIFISTILPGGGGTTIDVRRVIRKELTSASVLP